MPTAASFSFIFGIFKQTIQFLQQINVKKCYLHPVFSTGIQTHNLLNMSRLPKPLDRGSRPNKGFCSWQCQATSHSTTPPSMNRARGWYTMVALLCVLGSVTRKKSPNVYKSCLKMISQEK